MENNNIVKMIESSISTIDDKAHCEPLDKSESFDIELDHPVSMNMYCFKNNFFDCLEEFFQDFFANSSNLSKDEALLPDCVAKNIENGNIVLKNEITTGKWLGVTYKEDLTYVKSLF